MNKIKKTIRLKNRILEIIAKLNLNLATMNVLTEVASGNFIVTPLIAALAGAEKVYVVCKDSVYGTQKEVEQYLEEYIKFLEIPTGKIEMVSDKDSIASKSNIITNLGFVRPIDAKFIEQLPDDAAIPLMFESWEFRNEDIDIDQCRKSKIPVLGTKETDDRLNIFRYVGMSVLKLLLERNIEVYKSNILLVSSGEYLKEIKAVLEANGAVVKSYNPYIDSLASKEIENFIRNCDAVVVAEQNNKDVLIGENCTHIDVKNFEQGNPEFIHVAGVIEYQALKKHGIIKYPQKEIPYGYMTVTTDYVGVRPVIELHAGGLKVGQALVEGMRLYKDVSLAKRHALENSPAMEFNY